MPADLNRRAQQVWAHRAFAEAAAAQHYEQLALSLRDHEPASQFVWDLRDAAEDERRHSALCRDRAAELGWRGAAPALSEPIVPVPTSLRVVQAQLVVTLCIGETLNAALLHHELAASHDAIERALTRALLRDEVRHGRLGFRWLEDAAGRHDLAPLSDVVSAACHDALARLDSGAAASLSNRDDCARLFHETMRSTIIPSLEHCGIHVSPARRAA